MSIYLKGGVAIGQFLTVLASFGGSAWAIHSFLEGGFFNGAVAAMRSFRGYKEQITFDSSFLLRTATFFGRPTYPMHSVLLRAVYLLHHSNCSHTSLEVLCICFCHIKNGIHPIFEGHYIYFDMRTCSHLLFE